MAWMRWGSSFRPSRIAFSACRRIWWRRRARRSSYTPELISVGLIRLRVLRSRRAHVLRGGAAQRSRVGSPLRSSSRCPLADWPGRVHPSFAGPCSCFLPGGDEEGHGCGAEVRLSGARCLLVSSRVVMRLLLGFDGYEGGVVDHAGVRHQERGPVVVRLVGAPPAV